MKKNIINKYKKLIIGTIMAICTFSTSVVYADILDNYEVTEGDFVTVIVNGKTMDKESYPIIINNNLFLPARAIADELNATTKWEESGKRITIYTDNTYATLQINSNNLIYGNYKKINDQINYENIYTKQLNLPPVLYKGKTLMPVRAVVNALNTSITWNNHSNTATITSVDSKGHIIPTTSPTSVIPLTPTVPIVTASPIATKAPIDSVFNDTPTFQTVSARRVKDMNNFDIPYALVLYDSSDLSYKNDMNTVKKASSQVDFSSATYKKFFGLDMNRNTLDRKVNLSFLNDIIGNNKNYPIVIYNYKDDYSTYLTNPLIQEEVVEYGNKMNYNQKIIITPSPTSTPTATPTNTVTPTQTPVPTNNFYMNNIWTLNADSMISKGDKFVYIVYNSSEEGYYDLFKIIEDAVKYAGKDVYVTDQALDSRQFVGSNSTGGYSPNPTVYFIEGSQINPIIRPKSSSTLASQIKEFLS